MSLHYRYRLNTAYRYKPTKKAPHNIKALKEVLYLFYLAGPGVAYVLTKDLIAAVPEDHPTSSAKSFIGYLVKKGCIKSAGRARYND